MNKFTHALTALTLLVMSSSAAAIAIQGGINIGGSASVLSNGTNSTGLDFNCGPTCGGAVNMFPPPTGAFAGLGGVSTNTGLTLHSFLYSNIPSQVIWDINANGLLYSFTLTNVRVISGDTGNFSTLVLRGSGIFNITGAGSNYDATPGTWTFSNSVTSFSSHTIPEPTIIALLGLGLVGIGAVRRMRKTA